EVEPRPRRLVARDRPGLRQQRQRQAEQLAAGLERAEEEPQHREREDRGDQHEQRRQPDVDTADPHDRSSRRSKRICTSAMTMRITMSTIYTALAYPIWARWKPVWKMYCTMNI